ncbi:DDE-type integrase/transposase/recombinase [Microvirga guangxiensis]
MRFFRKLLTGLYYVSRVGHDRQTWILWCAKRAVLPSAEHRQSRYLNNRSEVSHQLARRRERYIRRFRSVRHAQQFLATQTRIHKHFQFRRHCLSANEYRAARDRAFAAWRNATAATLVV